MKMKRGLLSLLLSILLAAAARGGDLLFVSAETIDVAALLPPPPATGSAQSVAEMETVLKAQSVRSDVEVARAVAEEDLTPVVFQSVLGPQFTAQNCPILFTLLDDAARDSKYFTKKGKDFYARPRPRFSDSRVNPAVRADGDPAYPSGHATRGMLWARILINIYPEKESELLRRGQEIGWDRVLAGVHFPSDICAGQVLGQALAQADFKSREFNIRFAKARDEIKSVQNVHASALR
jgi:acid phosphatase (class A)